jgi:erythromycin esterase-like protein
VCALADAVEPIASESAVEPIVELAAGRSIVLLGESTHGTREFYAARATVTRRLIEEHGFSAVCLEADWPHAAQIDRWLRSDGDDRPRTALEGFRRFPQWMWRNRTFEAFVGGLRSTTASIYGLDLYSLHDSIAEVLAFLDRHAPAEAERARSRYACFDHFGDDPQSYGALSGSTAFASCEEAVVAQLLELRAQRRPPVDDPEEARWQAEMNALLVRDAESYYRAMYRGRVRSWNLRDTHMADALDAILERLGARGLPRKVVVWAHNSHLGDARATELGAQGELNLGQLARERHGDAVCSIGFTTYEGTVTAARDWDAPAERRRIRGGLPGSLEALFHEVSRTRGAPEFLLRLGDLGEVAGALHEDRLQRAIGVVYRPETERFSHYFHARVAGQFDAVVHFDRSHALEPLERTPTWIAGDLPETWPSAL